MVSLNHIRVSRRWPVRLPRVAALAALPLSTATPYTLSILLRCILVRHTGLLVRELPTARLLLRHSPIVHTALPRRRPRVRNYVVCGTLSSTFLVRNLPVTVVWIGILKNNVPGVEKTGEETETAEGNVDERVARAYASLYPYYIRF